MKRCHELTHEDGKMALIHPRTFMFIKTFEDVRAFMLDKTHISIFVDYSLSNLFGSIMVDPCFYVLEKGITTSKDSWFISLDQYTRTPNEKYKKDFTLEALDDYIASRPNKHNYTLPQNKLKIIKSTPFIYWISDEFREKFGISTLETIVSVKTGISTGDNEMFSRFWWEINKNDISENYKVDNKKWIYFIKGGSYNKWYGNIHLVINWENNGNTIKNYKKSTIRNEIYYFMEGISTVKATAKGGDFRYTPKNTIFADGAPSIFFDKNLLLPWFGLGVLNSHVAKYVTDCLNPTVNTQVGDLQRIPFVIPPKPQEELISNLAKTNIEIKKHLCSFSIIETNFTQNPLYMSSHANLKERALEYLNYENYLLSHVLLNEAIINEEVFKVYELSESDIAMVLEKEGKSIGGLSVEQKAKEAFLSSLRGTKQSTDGNGLLHFVRNDGQEVRNDEIESYINSRHVESFESDKKAKIIKAFETLYQSNNDLEEFCIKNEVNPINIWHWFKESKTLPKQRTTTIALEFLTDMVRELLSEDDDGIIPLVPNAGEKVLFERLHEKFYQKGFTDAQTSSFDSLLGKELESYLQNNFFKELSDHLNLFMYLPKTPFIWHLSSGEYKGFECYISIYKWSRDNLLRVKSVYIENRQRALQNRQLDLSNDNTASAQNEKDLLFKQLRELEEYKTKIDDLLANGYNPILDSRVGKNIAPLQKAKMISYEVLNAGQLKKYLLAEW